MKYKNKEEFSTLFEKYYKNNFDILILLKTCVNSKNGFSHLIYERIEKDKPIYYCNETDIKYFNSCVLKNAIIINDLDMIKYIMEKPVFSFVFSSEHGSPENSEKPILTFRLFSVNSGK